jgi:hypothetical protein
VGAEIGALAGHEKADDEAKQAEHGAKDLDDEDTDEPRRGG